MKNPLKFWLGTLTVALLALTPAVSPVGGYVVPASGATVSESGGSVCSQTVSNDSSVTVTKRQISGQDYCVITFERVGTTTWTVPTGVTNVDFLLIGGGGAGGGSNEGGGGGAGGFVERTNYPISGTTSIVVGSGGLSSSSRSVGAGGTPSRFGGQTAAGGGGGGAGSGTSADSAGSNGGSGGGGGGWGDNTGSSNPGNGNVGSSSPSFGNQGGSGAGNNGGGGGGAGGQGENGFLDNRGGNGGAGKASSMSGSSVTYAGGGGGGSSVGNGVGGSGGSGGGGNAGSNGRDGFGGGGGGAGNSLSAGSGGSGIVIVRYALTPEPPASTSVASGVGEMTLTYTAPTVWGGGTLSLEYTTDGGSNWRNLGETDGNTTISLESDGTALENNTLYTVKLRSKNTVGGSGYTSSEVTVGSVIPSPVGEILRLDGTNPSSYGGSGSTWTDISGESNNGTISGATWDSRSKSFAFDGSDDVVTLPTLTYDFSNGFAFHVVADFGTTSPAWEKLVEFRASDNNDYISFMRENQNDKLQVQMRAGGSANVWLCTSDGGEIAPGFHTYSVFVQSNGTCDFKVDGADAGTPSVNNSSYFTLPVAEMDSSFVGKSRIGDVDNFTSGSIQSVIAYNTAQETPVCKPVESTFTGNGTIGDDDVPYAVAQFTAAGPCLWTVPSGIAEADYLVIAGGGGGGGHIAGGGGAGEVVSGTKGNLTPGTQYTMTVGLGGVGGVRNYYHDATYQGQSGADSSAFMVSGTGGITANGGGGGGNILNSGKSGGSGGGAGAGVTGYSALAGGSSVLDGAGYGNDGGAGGNGVGASAVASGGGGAGSAGANSNVSSQAGGAGGDGRAFTITGASVTYAGGGGGGVNTGAGDESAGQPGAGGAGGGGAGGAKTASTDNAASAGQAGVANLGAGGGGASGNGGTSTSISGGHGGSGVVVVRYSLTPGAPTISSVAPGDGSIDVTFSAPSHTGGSSITDYEYSFDGTNWSSLGTASAGTETISGLTNGTAYTVRLRAVNGNGNGVPVTAGSAATARGAQTVTWSPATTLFAASDGSATLSSNASSSGSTAITYDVASAGTAGCALSGDGTTPTFTFSSVGTCQVEANAAQGGAYAAATSIAVTLTIGYRVTYDSNADQHQTGVIASGSVPSSEVFASGATVTVSSNTGSLTRTGFTLGGWNTASAGSGSNYAAGSGTFTISVDTTLYANWEIPKAARLIGLTGSDAVDVVSVSGVSGQDSQGIRGITTDGSSVYYRSLDQDGSIREVDFDGTFIADHPVTGLTNDIQRDLAYSSGCIWARGSGAGGLNDLYCIDTSTWTLHQVTVPASKPLETGGSWLVGNLIDFPDGRVGAVTASKTGVSGCPTTYCKVLRLYTPSGTGGSVSLAWSEDILLVDGASAWPSDDHGIATDGTYLYQIHHQNGYKVWALTSGSPSYLVFNGDGSGTCAADLGTSGTRCAIANGLANATFLTRDHVGKRYIVADYDGDSSNEQDRFYLTVGAQPPAGPGTPAVPGAPTGVSASEGSRQATVSWTAPVSSGGAPIVSYTVTASPGGATCTTSTTSCTVSGLTNGTGYTFTVYATNVGGNSTPSSASSSVTPVKQIQTITFTQPAAKTYGDSDFTATVSASSSLTVTLTPADTSICTVSGSTVSIVSVGTCSLTASQSGDTDYNAATDVTRTFTISPKAITMSVAFADKTYDGSSSATVSGTPSLTGLVTGDENYVAVDTDEITGLFATPTAGSNKSVSVTLGDDVLITGSSGDRSDRYTVTVSGTPTASISKANQSTVTVTSASSMVFGQSIPLVATGGSGSGALSYLKVSGPCKVSGSTVTSTGAGSCVVTATRAADTNYNSVTSSNFTITVAKANQSINFTSTVPVSAVSGTTYTPAATATSGLAVDFDIAAPGKDSVCSISSGVVTFLSSGTCVIEADQGGNSNYNAASQVTQTIVAGKINQTITFPAISGKDFDDPAFSAGATVSSGRTVTYATSTGSVCAVNASSGVVSIKTVGDCTVTASSAGDASYAAASDVSRTFTISPVVAGKPSITSVSFGDSSVTVAFSAPGFVGGDAIDTYEVVATSSGGSVTKPDCSTTSPCTITGLTNGSAYTLTVAAINAAGVGPASDSSPSITPARIADAVSGLATTPGDEELAVSWTALTTSQLGGGSFTRYDVYLRVNGGSWGSAVTPDGTNNLATRTTTSYTFTGLTNGTAYDVKIVAITSVNSTALSSNTSTALGVPATVPGAATGLTATALSNTTALASWSAPVDDGGSAISAYSVNLSCTFVNATDTFCELSGLTAGSTVTVTVGATNLMGTGSTVSVSITMPGGSSGSSGGGSSGGGETATASPTPATNLPVLSPRRVIVPIQPTPRPTPFAAPVRIVPERGFDPDAGAKARIGGQPATVTKKPLDDGGLSVEAGAFQLGIRLSTPETSGSATTAENTDISVPTGQSTKVSGGGLLPGSSLQVWLPGMTGESPKELARIPVRTDGTFDSELSFTARQSETPIPIGRQVMQVTGFDEDGNQTVVDMVVNIGQGAPAPEPNKTVNELPNLSPGQSLATSAGVPATVTIEARPDDREVAVISGAWAFSVTLPDDAGEIEQVDAGATITMVQTKTATVSGEGFQPDTRVDIWLFSDPTLLGSVIVSADGSFTGEVYMDVRYATVGEHTLQLQGVARDGFIKAANLGVVVQEPVEFTSDSAGGLMVWVILVGLAVALVVALLVVLVGRRRQVRR